ncbi:hypothetical protein [Massilia sp. TS11]|uniref:hypothetical protein n=1 Tax=Massilia sp. TS11 TaxID=2908003 RepID=UPI001EDB3FAB|nr:hypothetical protein [Massilia sp. TS11]MCG2583491.1 hypothetical protein [Massilia sp. TS11]
MAHHALSSQESYNPNHLLDILLGKMQLKNDAALSRALEVAPPVISKIRHHRLPVGASLLIRMHEVTGMSIRDLRDLMGDRRTKYRLSDAQGRPKPGDVNAQAAGKPVQSASPTADTMASAGHTRTDPAAQANDAGNDVKPDTRN